MPPGPPDTDELMPTFQGDGGENCRTHHRESTVEDIRTVLTEQKSSWENQTIATLYKIIKGIKIFMTHHWRYGCFREPPRKRPRHFSG
jgi:hypothetical protein